METYLLSWETDIKSLTKSIKTIQQGLGVTEVILIRVPREDLWDKRPKGASHGCFEGKAFWAEGMASVNAH